MRVRAEQPHPDLCTRGEHGPCADPGLRSPKGTGDRGARSQPPVDEGSPAPPRPLFLLLPEPYASSWQGHMAFTLVWQKVQPCWDTFHLQEQIQGADQQRELTWGTALAPAALGLLQHTICPKAAL